MSRRLLALLALLLVAHASLGAARPPVPVQQKYGDWTVACDNLRNCSAQGYRVQDAGGAQAGLWLSRDAGPQGAVHVQLHLSSPDGQELPDGSRVQVHIDGREFKRLPLDGDLPSAAVRPLLAAMIEADELTLTGSASEATVSLQGLKAALLKMDDVQGRVGTVSAWVAKGKGGASQVPAAIPAPVLTPAAAPSIVDADAALPWVRQLVRHPAVIQDCYLLQEDSGAASSLPNTSLYQVRPQEFLVLMECARAAYQTSYRLWRMKQRPGGLDIAPEVLPDVGEPALDLMNADFHAGELSTWHKGRGLGDCGGGRRWTWTATGFALRHAHEAPDCNGIFEGGMGLVLWQAEVKATKP